MSTLVPLVESGVVLNSKFLWVYAWDNSLVFALELRNIFRVRTGCGVIRSHSDVGHLGSVLAKPEKNNCSVF